MTYESAIRMLAFRMDLCERLESSRSEWTLEYRDRARAEGRYATQVVCELTGRSYPAVLGDVSDSLGEWRRDHVTPAL